MREGAPLSAWRWLGHSAVRIDAGGVRVYVEPFLLKPKTCPPADLVLVGNPRAGFLSPEDIAMVRGPATRVLGPTEVAAAVPGVEVLRPGDEVRVGGLVVRAVPACSRAGRSFFPRARGWLGWLVTADGVRYYHAGATDRIPEMEEIRADVAFLPVSGRYVMDADEAAASAAAVGAATRVALWLPGDLFRLLPGFSV